MLCLKSSNLYERGFWGTGVGASQRASWSYPTLNYSRKTPSKDVGSASRSPLIGLIHDFTAHEAARPTLLVPFVDRGVTV